MTYSDIKFVVGKAYIPIDKLKFELGNEKFIYCQSMQIGYKYALWYVLDKCDNYRLLYTNFKNDFPIFEIPYKTPTINNNLPL